MAMSVFYLKLLFSSSIAQNNGKNLILKENIGSSTFKKNGNLILLISLLLK